MLLRGPSNTTTFENHHVHGGAGFAVARRLFSGEEFQSSLFFFNQSSLQPGSAYGDHWHRGDEEVHYILEGRGLVQVDDEEHDVGVGDAILTRSGSHHSLRNTGDGPLRVLVIGARLAAEG